MPFVHQTITPNGIAELGGVVVAKEIIDIISNGQVDSIAYSSGGTGYVVGETFEFNAGSTVAGTAVSGLDGNIVCRGVVTAEALGVPSAVKILSAGAYTTLPTGATATTQNASASGTGLVLTFTTQVAQWTEDRGTGLLGTDYADDNTDFEWIATSVKATNAPTIGVETDTNQTDGAFRMIVATGYDSGATFTGQPGAQAADWPYLSVAQSGTIDIYLSITERRVNMCIRNGNNVQYGQAGLFIPFTDTDANYPFPGIVCGQSDHINANNETYTNTDFSGGGNAGLLNPSSNDGGVGPYQYRDNLSPTWLGFADTDLEAGQVAVLWPICQESVLTYTDAPQVNSKSTDPSSAGQSTAGVFSDDNSDGWFGTDGTPDFGVPGPAPLGTGSRLSFPFKAHIIFDAAGNVQPIGIIDGWENVHGISLTAFEEIETENLTRRYMVFPDTNGSELRRWCAMEKI